MTVNIVCLAGNVTRDAELKQTTAGSSVLVFTLAVNEHFKNNSTGAWEKRPNFFDCVMFGPRAEKLAQYITKGAKLAIAGRLRYRAWETDGGGKRSKVEVVAEEVELMSRDAAPQQQQPQQQIPGAPDGSFYDTDIPF